MRLFWLSLLLIVAAGSEPLRAHQAPSGWTYEYACCGNWDCGALKPEQVVLGPKGFVITIPPGTHPQVPADAGTIVVTVPYGGERKSPDGLFHICLASDGQRVLCLYAPPFGS